jgi:hypothetical protein
MTGVRESGPWDSSRPAATQALGVPDRFGGLRDCSRVMSTKSLAEPLVRRWVPKQAHLVQIPSPHPQPRRSERRRSTSAALTSFRGRTGAAKHRGAARSAARARLRLPGTTCSSWPPGRSCWPCWTRTARTSCCARSERPRPPTPRAGSGRGPSAATTPPPCTWCSLIERLCSGSAGEAVAELPGGGGPDHGFVGGWEGLVVAYEAPAARDDHHPGHEQGMTSTAYSCLTISTEISTAGIVPLFSSQCVVFLSSGQPTPGP